MTRETPGKEHFEEMYQGQPPWDIGRPQSALVKIADQVTGSILDAGCGTGENALFFAQRGHTVYGIDFLDKPISQAKQKAKQRDVDACFLVMDALALGEIPRLFDNVIDCGLFHVFSDEDRVKYVASLHSVLKPGGKFWMLCFSDKEPGSEGPRRVSQQEIHDAFRKGWVLESITAMQFDVVPDLEGFEFSPGGPHGWFVVAKKKF
jgi:cyclopropane fatty-acyl-phospholipid synthase-like methyltransferase